MTKGQPGFNWRSEDFVLRLLLSYFLAPLMPPVLMLLRMRAVDHMQLGDWLGIVFLYGIFGVAAMLVLGTPLLFCYLDLGWTGYVPFMAGGAFCAGITSLVVLYHEGNRSLVEFFTVAGSISGLFFRVILFGFRRHTSATDAGEKA